LPKDATVERKLTAILVADVVGYSRLMGVDEVGTLRALKAIRKDLVDPVIAAHRGRVVKTTGDGLLADFPSVVDAVACAVTIQRQMLERNGAIPETKRIVFRVGINVGDIIIDGQDILGDGVNIAARLESICEPGGLCISDIARDQVRDKLPLSFTDLGERQVKNIARPVRVFGLSPQVINEARELPAGHAAPAKSRKPALLAGALFLIIAIVGGGTWWAMQTAAPLESPSAPARTFGNTDVRPSIAVLPLVSLGGVEDDYFADGMTEDIIAALGRFSQFTVRSPGAVFAYKGKNPRSNDISRELDVRYIVDGSIRREPQRIRISIHLASAVRGALLWSEQYDIAPKDLFSVQDDITRRIAGTLATRLTNLELAKADTKPPNSLKAYDLVLRGRNLAAKIDRVANSQARDLLKSAIDLDPGYAPAYVSLGRVELNGLMLGWTADPAAALQRVEDLGRKAISLDPTSAAGHVLLGSAYVSFGDYDRATDEMRQAIELNSSDPEAYAGLASALLWSGDNDAAAKNLETAAKLGLNFSMRDYLVLGFAYLLADRNDDAIRTLERSLDRFKANVYLEAGLAAAYAQAGRDADAAKKAETVRKLNNRFGSAEFGSLLRKPEQRAKLASALQKAGL